MSDTGRRSGHVLEGIPILHAGLTAEVYIIRDREFLVLTRARGGTGGGLDYIPGGIVERGEDPEDAAVRETFEETGLEVAYIAAFCSEAIEEMFPTMSSFFSNVRQNCLLVGERMVQSTSGQ